MRNAVLAVLSSFLLPAAADDAFKFIWGESPYTPSAVGKSDRFGSSGCFSKLEYLPGVLDWVVERDGAYVLNDTTNPASGFMTFAADMRSSWPSRTIPGIDGERDWVHWYDTASMASHVPLPPGDDVRRWASEPYGETEPLLTPVGPDGQTVLEWTRDVEYTNGTVRAVRHTAFPYVYSDSFIDYDTLYPDAQDVYLVNPPGHRVTKELKDAHADLYEGFYERVYSASRGGDGHNSWETWGYGTTTPDKSFRFYSSPYAIEFFLHYPDTVPVPSDDSGRHMMPGTRRLVGERYNVHELLASLNDLYSRPFYECRDYSPDPESRSFLYRPGWVTDAYSTITNLEERGLSYALYERFLDARSVTWWSTTRGPVGFEVPEGETTTADSLTHPVRRKFQFTDVLGQGRTGLWDDLRINETGFVLSDLADAARIGRPGLVLLDLVSLGNLTAYPIEMEYPSLSDLNLRYPDLVTNAFPHSGKTVPDGTNSFSLLSGVLNAVRSPRGTVSNRLTPEAETAAALSLSLLDRTYQLPFAVPVFDVHEYAVDRWRPISISVRGSGTVDFTLTRTFDGWAFVPDAQVRGVSGSYSVLDGEDSVSTNDSKSVSGVVAAGPVAYGLYFQGEAALTGQRTAASGGALTIRELYSRGGIEPAAVPDAGHLTWIDWVSLGGRPGEVRARVTWDGDEMLDTEIVLLLDPSEGLTNTVTVAVDPPSGTITNGSVQMMYSYAETDLGSDDRPGDMVVGPLQGLDADASYSWDCDSFVTYASGIDDRYSEPRRGIEETNRFMVSVQDLDAACSSRSDFRDTAGKFAAEAVKEAVRTMKSVLVKNDPSDMDSYAPVPSGGSLGDATVVSNACPVGFSANGAEVYKEQEVDKRYKYTFEVPWIVDKAGGANYLGSKKVEAYRYFTVDESVTVYTNGETFVQAYTNFWYIDEVRHYDYTPEEYDSDFFVVTTNYVERSVTLDDRMPDSYSFESDYTFAEDWVSNVVYRATYDPFFELFHISRSTYYEDGGTNVFAYLTVTNSLAPTEGRMEAFTIPIYRIAEVPGTFSKSDLKDLEEEEIPVIERTLCYRGMTGGGYVEGSPVLVYWNKDGEICTESIGEDDYPVAFGWSADLRVSASFETPDGLVNHTNELATGSYDARTFSRQIIRTDWRFSHGTVSP